MSLAIAIAMRSNVPPPTPAREKAHGNGASAEPAMANNSGAAVSSTEGDDGGGGGTFVGESFTGSIEGGSSAVVVGGSCSISGSSCLRRPRLRGEADGETSDDARVG